jgi:G3E family GTPase
MTTPVTIVSGFLGAGKTTLLSRILADPGDRRYGVLVNDFGDLNIDAELIAESHPDRIALSNGCICCTIRDDLLAAAIGLIRETQPPEYVLIETSGVSNPVAVADVFFRGPGATDFRVDGIFCLIDGENFSSLDFENSELAIEQAAVADIVLLNKTDRTTEEVLGDVTQTLLGAQPAMRILRTVHADVPRSVLDESPDRPPRETDPVPEAHDHYHGASFESWAWRSTDRLSLDTFRRAIADLPNTIYRAKGILRFADAPQQRGIFQLVGKRSTLTFEPDPSNDGSSSLVVIGRQGEFDPAILTIIFDACLRTEAQSEYTPPA